MFFNGRITLSLFFLLLTLSACTSFSRHSGMPLPELTFAHIEFLPVNVGSIKIENEYDPALNVGDVSSSFPTPPDIALRRYIENRLEPAGETGVLHFVIEDAQVTQHVLEQDGILGKWLQAGERDSYEVSIRVRLYTDFAAGHQSSQSVLTLRRTLTIPDALSLAEREFEQLSFLELLMEDVGQAVTQVLEQKMKLVSVSAPPELR